MSIRAAYLPGSDIVSPMPRVHKAAYGGHVYAQAGLAVCQAWRELEDQKGVKPASRFGLHTMHGYFTSIGLPDRPFVYSVTPTTAARSISTLSVTAYQPTTPSTNPQHDHFPPADAALPPGPTCFTAMCSLKLPEAHSGGLLIQEDSPQKRYASILGTRQPAEWPPAPPVDIDGIVDAVGADLVGNFPVVDMKKVGMTAWNEGKPVHERVELILYRLLKPLPAENANEHLLVHAFTVDRNGLLMAGNHIGFGWSLGKAASLSYSFVVHVNADEAVIRYGEDEWWVQEATFPCVGAGRGIVMSKIWSPEGLHVATEYQDGLIRTFEPREPREEKL